MSTKTPAQLAREQARQDETLNRWRAVALTDLARALALQERLPTLDPQVAFREARLLAEPDGAAVVDKDVRQRAKIGALPIGEAVTALANIVRQRCDRALKVLAVPTPRKAKEAFALAAAAWTRAGEASDLGWLDDIKINEVVDVSPFLLELAGEGLDSRARFHESRLDEPLDLKGPGGGLVYSVQVRGCPVRSPVHIEVHAWPSKRDADGPLGQRVCAEVVAGSRRVRALRCRWRVLLMKLADGEEVDCPPAPLLALRKDPDEAADSFLADNLSAAPESAWSTVERLLQGAEEGKGHRTPTELALETGLSARMVTYYLGVANLAPRLLPEGRVGRLGIKLANVLAAIPDVDAQVRLYELTQAIRPEAARIEAVHGLVETFGLAGLATAEPLQAPPPKRAVVGRKVSDVLTHLAKLPKTPDVQLVRDFAGALEGNAAAMGRLPPKIRAVFETPADKRPASRRHPTNVQKKRK